MMTPRLFPKYYARKRIAGCWPYGLLFAIPFLITYLADARGVERLDIDMLLPPLAPKLQAPGMSLPDLQGGEFHLEDLRGRVVVINFWATWCGPCRSEMPALERAWQRLRLHDVELLAVATQDDPQMLRRFLQRNPVTFPVLLDESGKAAREWPFSGIPATFVIDGRGRMVYRALGARDWDSEPILRRILELRESPDSD